MKTARSKKGLSLLLTVIMLLTMMPITGLIPEAEAAYPTMKAYVSVAAMNNEDYHGYKQNVVSVTFVDKIDTQAIKDADYSWDVSADQDSSVMAWMVKNEEETLAAGADRYDVYIGGEGGVGANPNSSNVFYNFVNLKRINGFENFKTGSVTSFYCFFEKCSSLTELDLSSFDTSSATNMSYFFTDCNALESVDLSGWNTSKVGNMSFMFNCCYALKELDLGSFDTSKVTNMQRMFYKCENLKKLYTGDKWTVEQVTNSNAMFNCCYVIEGKIPFNYNAINDKQFATTEGYLTHVSQKPQTKKYTVTYEFVGDVIPEGVSVVEAATYEEGSTVTVADLPFADGYEFSGWSTEDADITSGSFVINNDVHIVGSWEDIKLYKVEYRYTEGFAVPEGAPELPEAVYYRAGDEVDRFGVPYVDRHIFIGWTTDDADVAGDMFTMPENDVVFYGYFKIPVESVEIIGGDITMDEGEKERINIYVKPEDATIKDIIYESDDESVVTVDKYGNITAVGEGTATITVYSKDDPTKSDTVTVTVKIPVTDIEVNKTQINLNKGDEDSIIATVVPENATNKKVTYKSDDESVVTVDEDGNIKAVGEGTATITVTSDDNGSIKETVTVTVKIPVTEITATEDFTIEIDDVKNVDAKVNEDATNKELIYETSNAGVVKVDNEGNVIGVGEGTATVTITSKDNPTITETVTVTVIKKYNVTYEYTGEVPETAPAVPGMESYTSGSDVAVKTAPAVDGYTFSGWSTDDAEVVDGAFIMPAKDVVLKGSFEKINYYNVTYKYEGEVPEGAPAVPEQETYQEGSDVKVEKAPALEGYTFSGWSTDDAEVTDGGFTIYNDVEFVGKWEKIIINVDNITVDKTEIELEPGETDKITVTVTPDNATDKKVTFESDDESIVKVDEKGNIEAVGEGTATITVKSSDDPTITETVTVTVKKPVVPVEDITVDKTEIDLEPGETDKITVTVTPDNATDKKVTFESDDESIVKVDEKGNIEAVGEGTATITVTTQDGEKKVTVTVKVEKKEEPENPDIPDVPDIPDEPEEPEYVIEVPSEIKLVPGITELLNIKISPDDGKVKPTFSSADETIARVDEFGNVTGVAAGETTIYVDFGNGDVRAITVIVAAPAIPSIPRKHHVCFGKTDGIGWYEVSVNGGDFFPQGPNSTLEVEHGSILVVRVQDMWIDDEFDFYVNGNKVPLDPGNTITVYVDGYKLIGALSMDVEVPDVDESLTLLQKIVKAIKDFFAWIASWFK